MDSLIAAAAHALATGDPLGALKWVALRNDAPALALRGIAMAQLGDFVRAKALLRKAARAFGPKEAVARARCIVAEAEIALVSRDLSWPAKALDTARAALERHGDRANAAHARHLEVRRLLLIGRLDEAERALAKFDAAPLPPALRAAHELAVAGVAMRRLRIKTARAALVEAERAARRCGHSCADGGGRKHRPSPEHACRAPDCARRGAASSCLRRLKRCWLQGRSSSTHAAMSCATPTPWSRSRRARYCSHLRARWAKRGPRTSRGARCSLAAFRAKHADELHRARLRVEIGRLRFKLRHLADVSATTLGFALAPRRARKVVVLAPPVEDQHASVLAFLADGESWSSSALSLALGASARTVQRALDALAATGKVQSYRSRPSASLDDPAGAGFHDNLVTPGRCPLRPRRH